MSGAEPVLALGVDSGPGLYEIVTASSSRYRLLIEPDMPRATELGILVALLHREPGAVTPRPDGEDAGTSSLRHDGHWFLLVDFHAEVGRPAQFFWLKPELFDDPDYDITFRQTTPVQSIARIGPQTPAADQIGGGL